MKTNHDIENLVYDILNIDVNDIKELTSEQKKMLRNRFTDNLRTNEIIYTNDYLIFTSSDVFKNWLYYAGFEYIDKSEYDEVRLKGIEFIILNYEIDRVSQVIDILTRNEEDTEENNEDIEE